MCTPSSILDNHQVYIYLAPIHRRLDNKRDDERAAIEALLRSDKLNILPDDISIIHQSNGAPHFSKEIGLGISISHSDNILAVAIYSNKYRAGIDIEERAEQAAQLIKRVANESELALMHIYSLPPILLWSAKEAAFKAYSDKIMTMSGQVILKSCTPQQQSMMLNVIENNQKQSLIKAHYLNTFDKEHTIQEPLPKHPFVLAFASNIPHAEISITSYL